MNTFHSIVEIVPSGEAVNLDKWRGKPVTIGTDKIGEVYDVTVEFKQGGEGWVTVHARVDRRLM